MSRPGALAGGLGRRVPTDFTHVEKYPLSALPREEQPSHVPMAFGVNWYVNFDSPVKEADGRYWIGRGNLGTIRGGHCICIRSVSQMDTVDCSRMMSLLNRKRYDAKWLWDQAKIVDEWPDTNPGDDNGTSVRAGCDVLRNRGHRRVWGPITFPPLSGEGISANRWATSWDDVKRTIGSAGNGVPLLNSWGVDYPHVVWLTDEAGARILSEDGEAAVVTDR
jgi:hypothetical protein